MRKFNNTTHLVRSMIGGRRKSYVFLVIAILCAVFFSSFALLITQGAIKSIQDVVRLRYGNQDYIINNANGLPLDDLVKMRIFSKYGTTQTLGYALFNDATTKSGFSVAKYDKNALSITNKKLIKGSLPTEKGEIAIEQGMLDKLNFSGVTGDSITLSFIVPDGTGFLKDKFEKTYTLTGILYDQYIYQMRWREVDPVYFDIPAAIVSDKEDIEAGGMYITKCYYVNGAKFSSQRLYDLNFDTSSAFEGIYDNMLVSTHDMELGTEDPALYYLLINTITFAILSVVLLFTSGFGIASAFSANADERKKQIGMLRAVGATKKQISLLLMREILLLSVITIPLGILLSCLVINCTKGFLGDMFVFSINIPIILLVALFSLVCIIISAITPLISASKISPMQAIRDNELSWKMKKQKIKAKRYFDTSKHIASRTIKLYRNHLLPINIFILVSVVILLIGAGIGPSLFRDALTNSYKDDFAIRVSKAYSPDQIVQYGYSAPGISERDRQDAQKIIGDGIVYGDKRVTVNLQLEKVSDFVTNYIGMKSNQYLDPLSPAHENYLKKKSYFGFKKDFITVECIGIDNDIIGVLSPAVYAGKIDLDKLSSGDEVILVVPKGYGVIRNEDGSTIVHQSIIDGYEYSKTYKNDVFAVGDPIDTTLLYTDAALDNTAAGQSETSLKDFERKDNTVRIGAIIELDSSVYFPFTPCFMGTIITNLTGFESLGYKANYSNLLMKLNYVLPDSERGQVQTELGDIATKIDNAQFVSYFEIYKSDKTMAQNIMFIIITLLILFFSMSVIMINNTVSANIRSSKSMIGTLRAVGSTQKDVQKIFLWQLIYMISVGTIAGILLSICGYIVISLIDPILMKKVNTLFAVIGLLLYSMGLLSICALNIRKKTTEYLKRSIITNIRDL